MVLAGRCAVSIALTISFVAFFPPATRAQTSIEVYPGPGLEHLRSTIFQVEVFDGSNWVPTFVYRFADESACHWHNGTSPPVNFLTFGTTGPVKVRVTGIPQTITSIDVSPHSKKIPVQLSGGQAVLTLNPNNKVWITANGYDEYPLFIFADAPKPPVPAGATYFGPGVSTIPAPGNHYKAKSGEVIYLDGGAWVRGNIDIRGTQNVQIMGPGILSGELWAGASINGLPFDQWLDYVMIRGDWFGGNAARVQGITIVDSPAYNFFSGATHVTNVKILSPWFYSTDGFPGVSHVDQSFVFNGDNSFATSAGIQNDNVTITHSFGGTSNNSVFSGGYYGFESNHHYTVLVDDVDVKTYNNQDWVPPSPVLASVFQVWVDNNDPTQGYVNQTYQNIRIEGNLTGPMLELKNFVYPWGGTYAYNPPLGNSYNLIFRNISVEGTQSILSEIKGWDSNNGFHNVVLKNISFHGEVVNQSNLSKYFDVNAYVSGLVFSEACAAGPRADNTAGRPCPRVVEPHGLPGLDPPTGLYKQASPSRNLVWTPPDNLTPSDAVTYKLWITGGAACASGCLYHPAAPSWYTMGSEIGAGSYTWQLQAVSATRPYSLPVNGPPFTMP